ncbi:hypothetical protein IV203_019865 [Nitzschia inconspicua]|uniref:Uncharacterized protein n=1 Tax=Nitzschia inconspicua TaxID=303405 RepID=A0A9K3M0N3_9STRA|nr:hypothetical protein IV203_019865 [Nitzschia inconspicua]
MKLFAAAFITLLTLLPTAFGRCSPFLSLVELLQIKTQTQFRSPSMYPKLTLLPTAFGRCSPFLSLVELLQIKTQTHFKHADPLTVTFTNDIHVTDRTYCILVKLKADGLATLVATKQFSYKVTAPTTGSVTVDCTMSDLGDVTTNDLAADLADVITGNANPGLIAKSLSDGTPVRFGDSFTVELSTLSGFDAEITSITIDCGTEFLTGNIGRQEYPDPAMVDVTLPLVCFADASRANHEVTIGVTWWINNDSVRRLRGLQNNDDLPDNGSFEYALDAEIVPMEDGSSASVTKFYYCASAASAGMAAVLLLQVHREER